MTLTPRDLEHIGKLLFGWHWKPDLAELLQVNPRTLRRMLAGAAPIPEGFTLEIEQAVRDHAMRLDDVLEMMAVQ